MKFQLDAGTGRYGITGYGPEGVRVNDRVYRSSVIVMPDRLVVDWPPRSVPDLTRAHMDAIAALEPDVVLLGTGQTLKFPEPSLLVALQGNGVGIECMDTGAACRVFAVLAAEGRRVACAILSNRAPGDRSGFGEDPLS
ncbi:MAG: Mth938-like domain-containing protein [Gammaproteobacteria bacterium]